MFGIRVARQLQLPTKEDITLKEKQGGTTTVKAQDANDITGNYRSSEGITGEAVWSTRAKWMDLYGRIGDELISIAVCDHPKNQSYPDMACKGIWPLFSQSAWRKRFYTGQGVCEFCNPGRTISYLQVQSSC